jgi:hypothetical protein
LLQIKDNVATQLIKGTGFWTFEPFDNIHPSSLVVAGFYRGVYMLEFKDNNFIPQKALTEFYRISPDSSALIIIIPIWASHPIGVFTRSILQVL